MIIQNEQSGSFNIMSKSLCWRIWSLLYLMIINLQRREGWRGRACTWCTWCWSPWCRGWVRGRGASEGSRHQDPGEATSRRGGHLCSRDITRQAACGRYRLSNNVTPTYSHSNVHLELSNVENGMGVSESFLSLNILYDYVKNTNIQVTAILTFWF